MGKAHPSPSCALPPCRYPEASPKAISGRTSYHPSWLAFHSYPQLIRAVFNRHRFGPPPPVTADSPWPWVDRRASGLMSTAHRPVRTRFPYAYPSTFQYWVRLAIDINSLDHYAKGTPSPYTKIVYGSDRFVGLWFQVLFHSPHRGSFQLSLTVLVHYRSPSSI